MNLWKTSRRLLGKSVIDMLQYSPLDIEDTIKLTFETVLKAEQSEFLDYSEYESSNKGNGYRSKLVQGFNRAFRIDLPRDRLGNFKPFFLDLIKQERENLDELAFTLYSKGLTTRDIEGVFTKIYGQNY